MVDSVLLQQRLKMAEPKTPASFSEFYIFRGLFEELNFQLLFKLADLACQ
jgi:hypothetical protein